MLRGVVPRVVGWLALVVALAGPHTEAEPLLVPTGRDLLVAVDLSASMAKADIAGAEGLVERIEVVRERIDAFLADRAGDRVGLIAFASDAYLISPLTFDTRAVAGLLDEVVIGLPGRKTDLGRAIGLAVRVLRPEPPGERVLIILSDGAANTGALTALDAAALAAENRVEVHVIGFAGEIEAPNAAHMRAVAERTGGSYFGATSSEMLADIYAVLDRKLPITAEPNPPRLVDDWTWAPLGLALGMVLLVGGQALSDP